MDNYDYTIKQDGEMWRWWVGIQLEDAADAYSQEDAIKQVLNRLRRLRAGLEVDIDALEAQLRGLNGELDK